MLSNSIIVQNNHSSFLFQTDLESDDQISELQFALFLEELVTKSDLKEVNIAFVVGEGNSALKVIRQEKILASLKEMNLLKKCKIQIIRGYNDYWCSQKDFKTEGQESLSQQEIEAILKKEKDNRDENKEYENQLRITSQNEIMTFLAAYPNTAIINLKPPRELIDISKTQDGKELLLQHVFYGTGSYNHRALFDPRKKETCQKELLTLLNQFKETFIFETYSAHESNSTSMKNAETLFKCLERATPGQLLYFIAKFMDFWAEHLLSTDRLEMPKHLTLLVQTKYIDELQAHDIKTMFNGNRADVTDERFLHYKQMLKTLADKLIDQQDILASVQKVNRLLGKWANLTECSRQFVNADVAWTAIIFGRCDSKSYNMAKAEMSFNGDYTVLSEAKEQSNNIHICLPGNLSVKDYNNLRKVEKDSKKKPIILQDAQKRLFDEVQKDLLNTIQVIFAATPKKQQIDATGLSVGSLFASQDKRVESDQQNSENTQIAQLR